MAKASALTAHAAAAAKHNIHTKINFETLSGTLSVRVDKLLPGGLVLDLPLADPTDPGKWGRSTGRE